MSLYSEYSVSIRDQSINPRRFESIVPVLVGVQEIMIFQRSMKLEPGPEDRVYAGQISVGLIGEIILNSQLRRSWARNSKVRFPQF